MNRQKQQLVRRLAVAFTAAAAVSAVAAAGALGQTRGYSRAGADCPATSVARPFLSWLDLGQYYLVPGGPFESGLQGWRATGGAAIVSGNEPYHVAGRSDGYSLSLPSGSSVTSPLVCVTLDSPDLRLFVRNTGLPLSLLRVDMTYTNLLGQEATSPVGLLPAGRAWAPSLPVLFLLDVVPQAGLHGQTWVSFTFTPLGRGNWSVDDVYVDPLKHQ
jgi:hypothetical protein